MEIIPSNIITMAETEEVVEEAEVTEEEIIEETIVETVEEERAFAYGWGLEYSFERSIPRNATYVNIYKCIEPWKDFMKTDDDLIPYRRRKLTARTNCLAIPKKMYVKALLEEFVDVLNDNQKDNLKEILQTECDFTKENPQESQNQSGTSKTTKSGGQDTGTKKKDQRAKSAAGGKRPASSGGTSKSAGSKPNKAENLEQKENEEPAVSEEVTESKVEETEAQENPTTDEPVEEPQNEDENFVDAT
ncbi:hypothetical protein C0J52_15976 [Blattella germanica]|nr:hypothetical protein C0J52_15976 [Blattella germanica]